MMKKCILLLYVCYTAFFSDAQGASFEWATHVGKPNDDEFAYTITTDTAGNVIYSGIFGGTVDFDPGPGVFNIVGNAVNNADVYISKLNNSGDFIWAKRVGGNQNDHVISVETDISGNIFVFGCFMGTVDFDPGPGISNLTSSTTTGAYFLLKLDASGNYLWSHIVSTPALFIVGDCLKVDANGVAYILGTFEGTVDFDPGPAVVNMTCAGIRACFVSAFSPAGNLIWARQSQGTGYAEAISLNLGNDGHIYITGSYSGTIDCDSGPGITNLTSTTIYNETFIVRLNNNGDFVWAKALSMMSSPNNVTSRGIAVSATGDVYVCGEFNGTVDFDPGPAQAPLTSLTSDDCFLLRLNAQGDYVWAKKFDGPQNGSGLSIVLDDTDNAYVTGYFYGTVDFNPDAGTYNLTSQSGSSDIFIAKYTNSGAFVFAKRIGSTGQDIGFNIHMHDNQFIYTCGYFAFLTDFDPGNGVYNLNSVGGKDAYVHKMERCLNSYDTINVSTCDHYTLSSGQVCAASGVYTDLLTNAVGCDSIVTVILTILKSYDTLNIQECSSYLSPSGLYTWTTSGTYFDTLVNRFGCDSILTVYLSIGNTTVFQIVTTCDSWISPSGQVLTVSGTYYDTLQNHGGCDSLITTQLTILHASTAVITTSVCDEFLSPSGQYIWTSSGVYFDTIPNYAGCDSLITFNLTINHPTTASDTQVVCNAYTSPSGTTWTASGTYMYTLINAAGCDSVVSLQLTVLSSSYSTLFPAVCPGTGYLSPDGTEYWTLSGTYYDTLQNAVGCDSILTVNLTVLDPVSDTVSATICFGESYVSPDALETWTVAGIYQDTLVSSMGCDSIIVVNLSVNAVNTIISSLDALTLEANSASGLYQWLDCTASYSWLSGETDPSFVASENGMYAVMVTENGCTDTSECVLIDEVSLSENQSGKIVLYPNPSDGNVTIDFGNKFVDAQVTVWDTDGRKISSFSFNLVNEGVLDLGTLRGMYLIVVQTDQMLSKHVVTLID